MEQAGEAPKMHFILADVSGSLADKRLCMLTIDRLLNAWKDWAPWSEIHWRFRLVSRIPATTPSELLLFVPLSTLVLLFICQSELKSQFQIWHQGYTSWKKARSLHLLIIMLLCFKYWYLCKNNAAHCGINIFKCQHQLAKMAHLPLFCPGQRSRGQETLNMSWPPTDVGLVTYDGGAAVAGGNQ